jgi:ribosome assembly protein RRB1
LSAFRVWDLSLEKDAEEEAEFRAKMKEQANAPEDLPPQLLFVHQVFYQISSEKFA